MMKVGKRFFILLMGLGFILNQDVRAQEPPPAPVVVSKVEEKELQKPVKVVGAVEPSKRSLVASEIGGLVEDFPVEEGDYVEKGDVLAQFETEPLLIRLREAKAARNEALARYELARTNFARFKELREKGVASEQQLQDMESERNAWSAELAQLKAQIDRHEYDLSKSKIVAPFNGYITREYTEVGQWIAEGGPVVELIDMDRVEIRVDVPERYVSQVKLNDTVSLNFDALSNLEVEGRVNSIVPQANREARTFPVKVVVENKNHLIKSGMVSRVSFMIGEPSLVKLVPKDAIVDANNNKFLYVVQNGTVQPTPVSTGIAYKDLVEVIGPVENGQLVVIRGNERLMPGQPVRIINQDGVPKKG